MDKQEQDGHTQQCTKECVIKVCTHSNLAPSDNPVIPHTEGDVIYIQIFQNIHGTHNNTFDAIYEVETIDKLGANVVRCQETNTQWTTANKDEYNMFIEEKFRHM